MKHAQKWNLVPGTGLSPMSLGEKGHKCFGSSQFPGSQTVPQSLRLVPGTMTTAATSTWGQAAGMAIYLTYSSLWHSAGLRTWGGAVLHVDSLPASGTESPNPHNRKETTHSSYCSLLQIMARINCNIFVILFRNLIQSTNPYKLMAWTCIKSVCHQLGFLYGNSLGRISGKLEAKSTSTDTS